MFMDETGNLPNLIYRLKANLHISQTKLACQSNLGCASLRNGYNRPPVDPHPNCLYHSFMFTNSLCSLRRLLLLPSLFLAALCSLPSLLTAQTADEIINTYLNARGGLNKIRAIRTERVSGSISFGPDIEGPFFVERERPLKMHMEMNLNGQTLIRVYDGKSSGWIYNPFIPNAVVAPMTPADLASIAEEADFEGPFIDYKAKGNRIEYVGKDEVEGKPAQKLKLTSKQGDVGYFFFDASTGLILKWLGTRKNGDKEVPWQTYFRDFRDVDGLKYPFLLESGAVDGSQIQKITANKIEVNIPINDSQFGEPKAPAAAAEAVPNQ
jgi:outer membrane lipoprotein-sorting protein